MTADEWKALQNRLVEAWEQFTHTLQQATDAITKIFEALRKEEDRERAHPNPCFNSYRKTKSYYLCNEKLAYRIERKPQRNLPYQRRNY